MGDPAMGDAAMAGATEYGAIIGGYSGTNADVGTPGFACGASDAEDLMIVVPPPATCALAAGAAVDGLSVSEPG
jgi:hypothetical protein